MRSIFRRAWVHDGAAGLGPWDSNIRQWKACWTAESEQELSDLHFGERVRMNAITMTTVPYAAVAVLFGLLYFVVVPVVQYFRDPKGECNYLPDARIVG
jgi:hypothetical protein